MHASFSYINGVSLESHKKTNQNTKIIRFSFTKRVVRRVNEPQKALDELLNQFSNKKEKNLHQLKG